PRRPSPAPPRRPGHAPRTDRISTRSSTPWSRVRCTRSPLRPLRPCRSRRVICTSQCRLLARSLPRSPSRSSLELSLLAASERGASAPRFRLRAPQTAAPSRRADWCGFPYSSASMRGKSNIFLIGPMGSGKTAVGRHLARLLHFTFHDSDADIETRTGVDIAFIFEKEGEPGFRLREKESIERLTRLQSIVLAT